MGNDLVAINYELIDSAILEYTNYIEKLKMIFQRVNDLMSSTKESYVGENAELLRRKYSAFSRNYNVVIQNVSSYIEELKIVKSNYFELSNNLSHKIGVDAVSVTGDYSRYQEIQ